MMAILSKALVAICKQILYLNCFIIIIVSIEFEHLPCLETWIVVFRRIVPENAHMKAKNFEHVAPIHESWKEFFFNLVFYKQLAKRLTAKLDAG